MDALSHHSSEVISPGCYLLLAQPCYSELSSAPRISNTCALQQIVCAACHFPPNV